MSEHRDTYWNDDDLEDDLEVASHAHEVRGFQRASSFSRDERGWASFDDAAAEEAPLPSAASAQPHQPLYPERPLYPEQPAYPERPAYPQQPTHPTPPTQRRAEPRQAQPAPARTPLRRGSSVRDVSVAEANRAAFDARYGEDQNLPPNGDRYGSRKQNPVSAFLARRRERRLVAPRRRHPFLKALFALLIAIVGLYLVICLPIDRGIAFEEPEASRVEAQKSGHLPLVPYYVLLLGSDAREGEEVSRSDTMILARIDVIANQITMISIPRDTMVQIEGYGTQKINAAYAFGGTAGAMRAVSDLLNVPIAEAAIVHFDGISGLVDALGGVTVDVPVDVYDPDYTGLVMSAGSYEMDGETALLFSRVRHGFALGDYQRQIDQQLVIKAIMDKARTLAPWDLVRVGSSMGSLFDTSMRCYDIAPILLRMLAGQATIYQTSLPSRTDMVDGVSYVIVDENDTATLMGVIDAGGDPAAAGVALGLEE